MGRIQDYPIDGTPENGDILLGTNVLDAKKSKNYSIQSIVGLVPAGPSGSQGVQGPAGPIGPVGPAGLEWQGAWDANTSYALNDAVGFNGASWFCISPIATTSNDDPETDTNTWALLAAQGAQGIQGVQGPTGAQGPAGVSTLPYLSYVALVSQVGTSAPITTFVYNNTGLAATWSRFQAGGYMLTFAGDVVADPADIWYSNSNNQGGTKNVIEVVGADSIALTNMNSSDVLVDGISYAPIEIRFYQ